MPSFQFELAAPGLNNQICLASLTVAAFPSHIPALLIRSPPAPHVLGPHHPQPSNSPKQLHILDDALVTETTPSRTRHKPVTVRPSPIRSATQFLAGGVAGATTKTLVAPLERVCCMLMAPAEGAAPGMLAALRTAWLEGGVRGLFRGHGATLAKIVPASAVQFAVYHGIKDVLLHRRKHQRHGKYLMNSSLSSKKQMGRREDTASDLTDLERFIAGALGGAAATLVTYPLESTRSMMSVAGGVKGGLLQAAASVLRTQGPRGLYRGFGPTLVSDAFGSALGFTLYEGYTRLYERATGKKAGPSIRAVMGAASAATVMTFTMPLEVVRRRLQVQGVPGRPVLYRGVVHCAQCIAHHEGLGAFYVAAVPGYLKAPPSVGGTYYLFELMMRHFAETPRPEDTAKS